MSTTTATTTHLETVQGIYEAFGRGDLPFILDQLDDDVSWDEGVRTTSLPWLQPGRGKSHVVAFFTALAHGVRFDTFEPVAITTDGDQVVGVVREAGVNLATGKAIEEDLFVHYWRFGPTRKVSSFRHIGDWMRHESSF